MVTHLRPDPRRGALATECIIALSILAVVMLPLAYSFQHEARLLRAYYQRAVAMEIVDGEMERLVAGGWRAFAAGTQPYLSRAGAVSSLPAGEFILTRAEGFVRLEWIPKARNAGGAVAREAKLK